MIAVKQSCSRLKIMKRHIPAALAALLVANAAAATTLPKRQPGLWQSTTNVTTQTGQPVPHGTNIVSVSCVNPDNDAQFFTSGGSHCTNLVITGQGATYAISGTCSNQGTPTTIRETLTYASPQAVTLTATVQSPAGPLKVTSQLAWQGGCLPGMVPGDEGSIVNGAFSKADNINDSDNQ